MGPRTRSTIAAVVVSVLLALLGPPPAPAGAAPGVARSAAPTATLTVSVVRPGTRPAAVTVRGPLGYRKVLTRSTTLRGLRLGTYTVTAAPVTTAAWRATATVTKRQISFTRARRSARVVVDYGTIISRKVEPVAPRTIDSFDAPSGSVTGELVSSERVPVGEIIVSGIGAAAPAGVIAKVVDVDRVGTDYVHEIKQATLQEAVPRGTFTRTFAVDVSDTDASAERRGARQGGAGDAPAGSGSSTAASAVSCSTSGEGGVEATATGGIDVDLAADWDFANSSVTLTARAHAGVSARAWLTASGQCTLAEQLRYQRTFKPITFSIGPVPIVILPKLEMFTGGSVQASGAAELQGSAGVVATLRAKASRTGLQTSFSGPSFSRQSSFTTKATVSAAVHARAVLTGELYGVAGPHASVKFGVVATADKNADPWWKVDAVASGGIGVKVDKCVRILWKDVCLNFDKSKNDLFNKSVRIADAGAPFNSGQEISDDVGGDGVSITDPTTDGDNGATGRVPGLAEGDAWVLSTGDISEVSGTSDTQASTDRSRPGNATLTSLSGESETYDATFVSMRVTPSGNRLRVKYLFATEEFPEYVGSSYNDVMGVFVAGQNCAHVPGSTTPVSVNTINNETNSQYFVDNRDGHLPTTMNGLTVPLSCVVAVTPGQTYDVLIGVADTSDGVLDSAVALLDGGITSYNE